MSWSVSLIGKPEKVSEALDAQSEQLTGDSKTEFDNALPNLKALLAMNFNTEYPFAVKLVASGHAYSGTHSSCFVNISPLDATLVVE